MKSLKRVVTISLMLALAACNTMEGLGQDVQKGGAAIENAADKSK